VTDRDDRMQPVAGIAHEALLTHRLRRPGVGKLASTRQIRAGNALESKNAVGRADSLDRGRETPELDGAARSCDNISDATCASAPGSGDVPWLVVPGTTPSLGAAL
jgi:hypothetical protein